MKREVFAVLWGLILFGCNPTEEKPLQPLVITANNLVGHWQCDYKLSGIKSRVQVKYHEDGSFDGRVFLNYPVTTGKGAVRFELVTGGSWTLTGTKLTETFTVLELDSNNASGHELSEPVTEELRQTEWLVTTVSALYAQEMHLLESDGRQTVCRRIQP